ncbi:uracil-DNA glycosylase family protein [Haloparvum alkalitolerans]|uniref:uracil-DNA glycosylase family protein n=1 Tax=Haloparvum TaxID=1820337 RepID=UPI00071E88F1|nr:uracil-DNA glycosylase family protein [Haloparvum sedimenti]
MRNVTDRLSNPFGMSPPCEQFVPGYGDANADFHVVGDHPGVHGGLDRGVPFTGEPWSAAFLEALREGGLLANTDQDSVAGTEPTEREPDAPEPAADGSGDAAPFAVAKTFLSYRHMCLPEDGDPTADAYDDMERFFDAELRAIAAHVLLPVGARATAHVLETYTAQAHKTAVDMDALHGTEIRGSGFLVVPIKEPADWTGDDADRLVEGLRTLQRTDYRRETDLGRFIAGSDPYLVR